MPSRINIGIADIELKELVDAIRSLTSISLDQKAKDDVKEMGNEIIKSYEAVVDSLTPFIHLDQANDFNTTFFTQHTAFINNYLNKAGEIRTHCDIVKQDLDRIIGPNPGHKITGWIQNKLNRLKDEDLQRFIKLKQKYEGADNALKDAMDTFLNGMNMELDSIAKVLKESPANEDRAKNMLTDLVSPIVPELTAIKKQLDDVRVLLKSL